MSLPILECVKIALNYFIYGSNERCELNKIKTRLIAIPKIIEGKYKYGDIYLQVMILIIYESIQMKHSQMHRPNKTTIRHVW